LYSTLELNIMNISNHRLLVTGATGLMGNWLLHKFHSNPLSYFVGYSKSMKANNFASINLTHPDETKTYLNSIQPNIIIHTVALANVDACEENHFEAFLLNVQTTKHIVNWIEKESPLTKMIYISTDQVYNGPGKHDEKDASPTNVYALTKLWAEDIVSTIQNFLILRTNFFALSMNQEKSSFANWLINCLIEKKSLTLFTDIFFNPLYIKDFIDIIVWLIENEINGVFNLGAKGNGISKADFALKLADLFHMKFKNVTFGSVHDSSLKANRPLDMRMSTRKIEKIMEIPLPSIDEGLLKLYDDWNMLKKVK